MQTTARRSPTAASQWPSTPRSHGSASTVAPIPAAASKSAAAHACDTSTGPVATRTHRRPRAGPCRGRAEAVDRGRLEAQRPRHAHEPDVDRADGVLARPTDRSGNLGLAGRLDQDQAGHGAPASRCRGRTDASGRDRPATARRASRRTRPSCARSRCCRSVRSAASKGSRRTSGRTAPGRIEPSRRLAKPCPARRCRTRRSDRETLLRTPADRCPSTGRRRARRCSGSLRQPAQPMPSSRRRPSVGPCGPGRPLGDRHSLERTGSARRPRAPFSVATVRRRALVSRRRPAHRSGTCTVESRGPPRVVRLMNETPVPLIVSAMMHLGGRRCSRTDRASARCERRRGRGRRSDPRPSRTRRIWPRGRPGR